MDLTTEEANQIVAEAISRGFEHYRKGEASDAAALYGQVLKVDCDNVIALQMLGLIQSKCPGESEEALKKLKRAEELEPENAEVHNNLGLVLSWSDGRNETEAERHYRRAVELNPHAMHFRSNLAIHLKTAGRVEEAIQVMREAIDLEEGNVALHFNYATMMGELKRWAEAEEHYQRVIEIEPSHASAHYNLSNIHLNLGDLERGWKEYEWRWETYPTFKKIYKRFPDEKRWDGTTDPAGKKFFLYAEQGMGDTIQFSRFIKDLRDRGASVTFEDAAELRTLMGSLVGPDKIVTYGNRIEEFDYHCSVLSLPNLLGINKYKDISGKPYLRPNYKQMPRLSFLEDKYWEVYDGLRIGIAWAGNPVHKHDPWRSTHLRQFQKLQIPGVKMFSLQKDTRNRFWPGFGERDLTEGAEGMSVVDMKEFMVDYNATAALIERMDLVICVDTATAHLAGALGKPVWLLLSWHNDWRWLHEGQTTPWYDSMTLYRQPKQNDWDSVFRYVRQDLVYAKSIELFGR